MASQKEWDEAFSKILSDTKSKKKEENKDWVNHPSHYNGHTIKTAKGEFEYETIDLIGSVVNRLVKDGVPANAAYCIGNAIKYIDRLAEKPGDYGKDQKSKNSEECMKVSWYMNKAAELIGGTK